MDVIEIMKIRASSRLEEDVLASAPRKFSLFTVNSAYSLAFDGAHRGNVVSPSTNMMGNKSCWKLIWSCGVPLIVRSFAWRVATNTLPTWQNKQKIGLEVSSSCPI